MKIILISLLIIAVSQCFLVTPERLEQLIKNNQVLQEIGKGGPKIPETTCNVVDPTPILPKGMDAGEFIVRSGYNKLPEKGNSAFGFIFWGAMAAKGDVDLLKTFPTLIWLQGGPGGSSQYGDFTEMGPIMVDGTKNFTYTYNPYSWNQQYNMIFIDNPIGTGLSVAETFFSIPVNQDEVAIDFYAGLEQLYSGKGCFADLGLTETPLIITGESYAGKYVPSICEYILKQDESSIIRQALMKGGIAVGDGFTDPQTIMDVLPDFGYNLAMVNQNERNEARGYAAAGDLNIKDGKWYSAKDNFGQVLDSLTEYSGLFDVYNFANNLNGPETFDLTGWLNNTAIKTDVFKFPETLNYASQSNEVYLALSEDFMKINVVKTVKKILDKGYPVLFYNGQNDVIVCTPCTEVWLDKVKYSGSAKFQSDSFQVWNTTIQGQKKVTGYYKQSDNLVFATVNQAGHMVPTDQPEAAYEMITAFVDYVVERSSVEDKQSFDENFGIFKNRQSSYSQKEQYQTEI